jgi:hypothetical protein
LIVSVRRRSTSIDPASRALTAPFWSRSRAIRFESGRPRRFTSNA